MNELCMTCGGLDSLRCLDCCDLSQYSPLVELRPATKPRKPYTPPTAEVVLITNEMHLRAMTREELVDLLYRIYLTLPDGDISSLWCDGKVGCIDADGEVQCGEARHRACILRWLNAPYVPKEAADAQ